jgi:hypothetical protein
MKNTHIEEMKEIAADLRKLADALDFESTSTPTWAMIDAYARQDASSIKAALHNLAYSMKNEVVS